MPVVGMIDHNYILCEVDLFMTQDNGRFIHVLVKQKYMNSAIEITLVHVDVTYYNWRFLYNYIIAISAVLMDISCIFSTAYL